MHKLPRTRPRRKKRARSKPRKLKNSVRMSSSRRRPGMRRRLAKPRLTLHRSRQLELRARPRSRSAAPLGCPLNLRPKFWNQPGHPLLPLLSLLLRRAKTAQPRRLRLLPRCPMPLCLRSRLQVQVVSHARAFPRHSACQPERTSTSLPSSRTLRHKPC